MNETEIRNRLFDLAADAPKRLTAPPQLLRRARRRVGITLASVAVFVLALGFGGIASVHWLSDSAGKPAVQPTRTPIEQSPRPETTALPELRRDEEVIMATRWTEGHDLVAVDPNTGHTRTLVDGEEFQGRIANAAWSPDGRWLAYDILAHESGLWVMSAQGQPRQVAEGDGALDVGSWAWSPAGTQLATIRNSTLILLDLLTGRETDLGATVGDVTTRPVWSSDGNRIVYGVQGGVIYSVDVDSGEHSVLLQLPGGVNWIFGIDWSPDGGHIAIHADAGGPPGLYLMNADGSGLRLVDDNVDWGWNAPFSDSSSVTAWSPNGDRLAYADFSGPGDRELRIWTVSPDESAPSLVASDVNGGGYVAWSPDGSQIAFDDRFDPVRPLVVNADGTGDPREIDELTYLSWGGGWYFCFCYG